MQSGPGWGRFALLASPESTLNDATRSAMPSAQGLADRAFARAAGSDPIDGNAVRILRDAAEHFPVVARRDSQRRALDPLRKLSLLERRCGSRVHGRARRAGPRRCPRLRRLRLAGVARRAPALEAVDRGGRACAQLQSAAHRQSARMALARPPQDGRDRRPRSLRHRSLSERSLERRSAHGHGALARHGRRDPRPRDRRDRAGLRARVACVRRRRATGDRHHADGVDCRARRRPAARDRGRAERDGRSTGSTSRSRRSRGATCG